MAGGQHVTLLGRRWQCLGATIGRLTFHLRRLGGHMGVSSPPLAAFRPDNPTIFKSASCVHLLSLAPVHHSFQ